jgi:DNA-binding FadR family transcriptional regulator
VHDIARRHLALPSAIAESGGNPVVQLFTQTLNQWTVDILPTELGTAALRDREMRRVNDILRSLVDAIANGDTPGAGQAARAFAERSLQVSHLLEDRRQRASIDEWLTTARGGSDAKLAQRIALVIARDLASRDWPSDRLGDEAGLIQRFGISRAVLREAIRLLELHGILRPQRGRGGGLMIGRPNAEHTIASAKRYLRRAKLRPIDYLTVRDTLESGAIHLAIERADDRAMAALQASGVLIAEADDSEVIALAIDWHGQLSGLGRNRALSLLLRILFALTEEPQASLPAEIAQTLRDRHLRLSQTVSARDETAAQKVAQEHISWLRHVLDIGLGSLSATPESRPAAAAVAVS